MDATGMVCEEMCSTPHLIVRYSSSGFQAGSIEHLSLVGI